MAESARDTASLMDGPGVSHARFGERSAVPKETKGSPEPYARYRGGRRTGHLKGRRLAVKVRVKEPVKPGQDKVALHLGIAGE
jgi:hypothetical protein